VRQAAALPFEGFDLPGIWGVADVESAAWPHQKRACLFMLPRGGIVVVIPIGTGRYRIVANRPKALEVLPTGLSVDHLRREAGFEISIRQVQAYSNGPVFLAGDAAHCHSPAGGRGMNLGIADAASFARRLTGENPGDSLEGYSNERHAHGRETIKLSENLRRTMTRENAVARWLVRSALRLVGRTPALQKRLARQVLDI
jgi:2-polyprenyl-6-methoxyphenol hydroxylase-like FAD-dependent oxidoreductase